MNRSAIFDIICYLNFSTILLLKLRVWFFLVVRQWTDSFLTVKEAKLIALYNYTRWRQLVNHSGISGQEMIALFRNAIEMNIDMQLKLRLDLHSPENVELP